MWKIMWKTLELVEDHEMGVSSEERWMCILLNASEITSTATCHSIPYESRSAMDLFE